jgi:hypothetical protein
MSTTGLGLIAAPCRESSLHVVQLSRRCLSPEYFPRSTIRPLSAEAIQFAAVQVDSIHLHTATGLDALSSHLSREFLASGTIIREVTMIRL